MKRSIGFLEIMLAALTLVVVVFLFTLAIAVLSPQATERTLIQVRQTLQSYLGPSFDVASKTFTGVTDRALDGYDYRIRPVPERVKNVVSGREERRKADEEAAKQEEEFKKCLSCHEHENLFDRTAIDTIFIDHKVHDDEGIGCDRCHANTSHDPPAVPSEQTCLDCHEDQKGRDGFSFAVAKEDQAAECTFCHAPGSIIEVVPKEYISHFLDQRSAHTKALGTPHAYTDPSKTDPEKLGVCFNCHRPSFCNACHLVFHNTIPEWIPNHGPSILRGVYSTRGCWQCHSANWCATKCHANSGRQRTTPFLNVPNIPLETMLR